MHFCLFPRSLCSLCHRPLSLSQAGTLQLGHPLGLVAARHYGCLRPAPRSLSRAGPAGSCHYQGIGKGVGPAEYHRDELHAAWTTYVPLPATLPPQPAYHPPPLCLWQTSCLCVLGAGLPVRATGRETRAGEPGNGHPPPDSGGRLENAFREGHASRPIHDSLPTARAAAAGCGRGTMARRPDEPQRVGQPCPPPPRRERASAKR